MHVKLPNLARTRLFVWWIVHFNYTLNIYIDV